MKHESAFTMAPGNHPMTSKINHSRPLQYLKAGLAGIAIVVAMPANAVDFGPDGMFSLNGFAEVTVTQQGNYCLHCQVADPNASKQIKTSDAIIPGKSYGDALTTNWQVQPDLSFRYDLGSGVKLGGNLSQRWRQGTVNGYYVETRYGGTVDVPDYWYNKSLSLSHEDYGSLRIGDMTTRTWSVADYPYATNLNVSPFWSDSGAGYGLIKDGFRYTSRVLDVLEGDLVLEGTYSAGDTDFKIHKPMFLELYTQFHRGDLVVDAMYQNTRNGRPSAWSHGPFYAPADSVKDDAKIGGSAQSIAMAMARYQVNDKIEVTGGIRRNYWSGAYAVQTQPEILNNLGVQTQPGLFNPMFNVDWGGTRNGVMNPGYSATSYDEMLGVRYRMGKWIPSAAIVHLGKASTDNPSERGQSNSATVGTLGLNYDFGNGLNLYGNANLVHYGRLGLSPLSMPGNSAFTNVDSRVNQNGVWVILGGTFVF